MLATNYNDNDTTMTLV